MYKIIRSLLFLLPPERAHEVTTSLLNLLCQAPSVPTLLRTSFRVNSPHLQREVFGLQFPNPLGLAAGFDKNAEYLDSFSNLGFGFIEIGTVTPRPQPGNEKPRLFRLKGDQALINRMGFNNQGLEEAQRRLSTRPANLIVGGNIGKNKITPVEEASLDYLKCFRGLYDYVDYFVVNVSSPNTPNLRDLQEKEPLRNLLSALQEENQNRPKPKPILLKIAPDISWTALDDILAIVEETRLDGIVATNTTINREGLSTSSTRLQAIGNGGLSGSPLRERSTEIIRYIRGQNQTLPVIAVGGIDSEETALEKLEAGANLLQIYTGFVYEGPGLLKRINQAILKRLEEA